jgi:hypothetical protein
VEQAALEIEKLRELIDRVPCKARRNLITQLQNGLSNEERRKRIRRTAN